MVIFPGCVGLPVTYRYVWVRWDDVGRRCYHLQGTGRTRTCLHLEVAFVSKLRLDKRETPKMREGFSSKQGISALTDNFSSIFLLFPFFFVRSSIFRLELTYSRRRRLRDHESFCCESCVSAVFPRSPSKLKEKDEDQDDVNFAVLHGSVGLERSLEW